jgi:excisionase family DNA binding protein
MSSNIKVQRICQHCSNEFTARTTVTKYCSDKCSKAAFKARKRAEKVKQSNAETTRIKNQSIEQLKAKEFLSINEVCQLVGISRRTVYRLIEQGDLKKIKVGSRTLIKRLALNKLLNNKETGKPEIPEKQINDLNDWNQADVFDIKDYYTLTEIQDKYKVSESTVQQLIKRNSIPKIKKGWYAYVPIQIIDELLT